MITIDVSRDEINGDHINGGSITGGSNGVSMNGGSIDGDSMNDGSDEDSSLVVEEDIVFSPLRLSTRSPIESKWVTHHPNQPYPTLKYYPPPPAPTLCLIIN